VTGGQSVWGFLRSAKQAATKGKKRQPRAKKSRTVFSTAIFKLNAEIYRVNPVVT
jgi:hypothetical protein